MAINEEGVLNSSNTLKNPIHLSLIEVHGSKDSVQEIPINPIICFRHINF